MAQRSNAERSADKPNVSASKVKVFQRSRLYLQLITVFAIALAFSLGISITFTNIAPISISHFSWTVYNTSHDSNDHSFKVCGSAFYFFKCTLEVIHSTAAAWAGNIFWTVEAATCCLHEFINEIFSIFRTIENDFCSIVVEIGTSQLNFIQLLVKKSLTEVT